MNINNFDFVSPHQREVAERIVRNGWPELGRRFYGALEHVLAMEARYAGAGTRNTKANERTVEARRALDGKKLRFRIAGKVATEEDLRPENEELERAVESEKAAEADWTAAGKALRDARVSFNREAICLAEVDARGERLRRKDAKPRTSDRTFYAEHIAKMRAEAKVVQNAPPPVAVYKDQARAKLKALAVDPFKPSYADGEVDFRWPVIAIPAEHQLPGRVVTAPDPVPLVLALFGDEIERRILARIDADHKGDTSLRLTKEEKKARLTKLRAGLMDLEREYAALIVHLAGDAPEIAFPPDLSPLATLGAEVIR